MRKIAHPERILEKDSAQIGVPRERVQQRSAEKEILEIFENFPQERISESTQIVDGPVPQIAKETPGVVGLAPRERVQQWTVDAPTPRVLEETVEMVRSVSHERVLQRAAEQIKDARQSLVEVVEAVTLVPWSERHCFRRWT